MRRRTCHHDRQVAALNAAYADLAERYAKDPRRSEDALQRAALELWSQLRDRPGYCCDSATATPSVAAARHLLEARASDREIDEYRGAGRRPAWSLDAATDAEAVLGDAIPAPGDALDARMLALDARAWCDAVEAALPDRHAEGWRALRMRAAYGLDAPEVAGVLGLSPDATRQRMSRCSGWVRRHAPAR